MRRANTAAWRHKPARVRCGGAHRGRLALLLGLLALPGPVSSAAAPTEPGDVWLLELEGAIGPATGDYIVRHLEEAEEAGADLFVLRLDTPGGLAKSMRTIIKAILDADIAVATWVAPNGSRAASAGTYILYASHVAVMAPATNVGAATPVQLGGGSTPTPGREKPSGSSGGENSPAERGADSPRGQGASPGEQKGGDSPRQQPDAPTPSSTMERKTINDAVAYIRGLAELRGRNADWAEAAVRDAASLSASEALERNVIDLIAADLDTLLDRLDGQTVSVNDEAVTLDVANASVHRISPDWRVDFLSFITNPNVAYILMMVGVYGLIFEFTNPGLGIPGVAGVICLLLGFYAMQMLPISAAGLALLLLGIVLMVTEAFSPTFGVLGAGGVAAFTIGSIILMDTDLPAYQISLPIIAAFAMASVGLLIFAVGMALRAQSGRIVSGQEAMIGATGIALEDFEGPGRVRVMSERWQAYSEQPIRRKQRVVVEHIDVDGLVVTVRPAEDANQSHLPTEG